jgi:hypothetical protein
LKGNYQQTSFITASGEAAEFTMGMSADGGSRVEMPIDPTSWDKTFQAGEDELPAAEEQPGFLFMSALATMTLAAVYLPSRKDSENVSDRS